MTADKALFIGGQMDGKTAIIPEGLNIQERVTGQSTTERYYRYPMNSGKVMYTLMVLTSIPQDQVLGRLLGGYKP